jgi:hypothetical protein
MAQMAQLFGEHDSRWYHSTFTSIRGNSMQILVASLRVIIAIAVCLVLTDAAKSQQPVEVESDAGVVTMVGTVEAIDETRQVVTLVGPNSKWVEVKVGPEHTKLIKLKEKITISYADEVAVALRKVSNDDLDGNIESEETSGMNMNAPTTAEQDWVESTPSGVTDFSTIEISDTIAAIDRGKRTITFAGTGGKTRTIKIAASVQGFDQVEVGDVVVLEVTRAVAVNVKPI